MSASSCVSGVFISLSTNVGTLFYFDTNCKRKFLLDLVSLLKFDDLSFALEEMCVKFL